MNKLIAAAAIGAAFSASADQARFEHTVPLVDNGVTRYRFVDTQGQTYEVGYRLEGNTLYFPYEGTHELPEVSEAEAERLLRETYGLRGERDALVRTKGLE